MSSVNLFINLLPIIHIARLVPHKVKAEPNPTTDIYACVQKWDDSSSSKPIITKRWRTLHMYIENSKTSFEYYV